MTKIEARILHTMLRVKNLEASIEFYTENLGMKLLRRQDFETGRFTLAFVGYGLEEADAVIELTFNWDQEIAYDIGLPKQAYDRKKKGAQYGSGFDKAITKLAKKNGFKLKKRYIDSLLKNRKKRI